MTKKCYALARKQLREGRDMDYQYLFNTYIRIIYNPYKEEREELLKNFIDLVMFKSVSQACSDVRSRL